MTKHRLDDVLSSVASAAINAQRINEEQHISILKRYFDREEDGTLSAKSVKINVPDADAQSDRTIDMDVPLITLVPYNSLALSDLEIEFEASLSELNEKENGSSKQLNIDLGNRIKTGAHVKVKVGFKRIDPPEGLQKATDNILKQIY